MGAWARRHGPVGSFTRRAWPFLGQVSQLQGWALPEEDRCLYPGVTADGSENCPWGSHGAAWAAPQGDGSAPVRGCSHPCGQGVVLQKTRLPAVPALIHEQFIVCQALMSTYNPRLVQVFSVLILVK